jgi:hypothetical protein
MKLSELTPEQKRVAIAEACGFSEIKLEQMPTHSAFHGKRNGKLEWIPEYLNDLNAMHEAENTLQWNELGALDVYLDALARLVDPVHGYRMELTFAVSTATAEQRADAFLLATGRVTL